MHVSQCMIDEFLPPEGLSQQVFRTHPLRFRFGF
jgi:hypothetical protein